MPLRSIRFPPGVIRDETAYAAEGRWSNSDKVRFRGPDPESIGGWQKTSADNYLGIARRLDDWATVDGSEYIGIGTTSKLYVNLGDTMFDITPVRTVSDLGSNPITTTSGSPLVSIADTGHGAVKGDYVTLSGVGAPVGGISDTVLNAEHQITSITDADNYVIRMDATASSSTSGGGSSVQAEYQVNVGLDTYVSSSGWGSGPWGSGAWGGSTIVSPSGQLRNWAMVPYGDDLLACIRGGGIFYWDESAGTSVRAIKLEDLSRISRTLEDNPLSVTNTSTTVTVTDNLGHDVGIGDTVTLSGVVAFGGIPGGELNADHVVTARLGDTQYQIEVTTAATSTTTGGGSAVVSQYYAGQYYAPDKALSIGVSEQARHVIAFGTTDIGEDAVNPLRIRWSDAGQPAVWRPTPENLAGGQTLSVGSIIVSQVRARQERLIFTNGGIVSMRYIGEPFVFSFNEVASGMSIIGPNAGVAVEDEVYFMDRGGFYRYSGSVEQLVCPQEDTVFQELDRNQPYKVFAGANTDYNEVWWFYQSVNADQDVDRYICYNYEMDVWYGGSLERGAWIDANTRRYPISTTTRSQTSSVDPIATTISSSVITFTYTDHKLTAGDIVQFKSFASVGGIPDEVINTQMTVASVVDADTFTVDCYYDATSTATGGGQGVVMRPNYLYSQDVGYAADDEDLYCWIESGDFDIDDGENFMFVHRLVPDIKYRGTTQDTSVVTVSLGMRRYPMSAQTTPITVAATPILGVSNVRGRGRQGALRVESSAQSYGWRLGNTRIDMREDGRN